MMKNKIVCVDDKNFNRGYARCGYPRFGVVYNCEGTSFAGGTIITGLPALNSQGVEKGWQPRRFVTLEYFKQEFSIPLTYKDRVFIV